MRLIPKAKPIRIRISSGGVEHSSLDTLLENFDLGELLCLHKNGSLVRWLNQIGALDIIEKLKDVKIQDFSAIKDDEYTAFAQSFFPDIAEKAREIAHRYEQFDDGEQIVRWHKIAYCAGNLESAFELGLIYERGLFGVAQSYGEALTYYKAAADEGMVNAIKNMAQIYNEGGGGIVQSTSKAIELLTPIAKDAPDVAYLLAKIYYNQDADSDEENARNEAEALSYLRIAADGGYKEAYSILGLLCSNLKKYDEAIAWLELAKQDMSTLDNESKVDLLQGLGRSYLNHLPNSPEIVSNYKEAAFLGSNSARITLGTLYENGLGGLEQDYNQMIYWYKSAADAGDADGQCNMGRLYMTGEGGVSKDFNIAVNWFKKAVAQGHSLAKLQLALCYDEMGIRRADSYNLIQEVANSDDDNNADAQCLMGEILEKGLFCKDKNRRAAMAWYKKAAENGNEDARERYIELMQKQSVL